jgi:hypothetical protein
LIYKIVTVVNRKIFKVLSVIRFYRSYSTFDCFAFGAACRFFNDDPVFIFPFYNRRPKNIIVIGDANFGNAVIKLSNAICVAMGLRLREIRHQIRLFRGQKSILGIKLIYCSKPTSTSFVEGEFFLRKCFCDIDYTPFPKISGKLVGSLLERRCILTKDHLIELHGHLVIHIRSGDVFNRSNPHSLYGQPPFAFYRTIIQQHRYSFVEIVSEDNLNPVIDALLTWGEQIGIEIKWVKSSLLNDFKKLASASNLVLSRGTFPHAFVNYSDNIRRVYSYHYYSSNWSLGVDERHYWGFAGHIEFWRGVERDASYVRDVLDDWHNFSWQRDAMLGSGEVELIREDI